MLEHINPEGWAEPRGYANGTIGSGRVLFVAGQIGWNARCEFESDEFLHQFRQTLDNVVAVVRAAGGGPEHIASMTWYVIDKRDYLADPKELGRIYRAAMGRNFPAIACVEVKALIEDRAKIEIQATALLPASSRA